MCCYNSFRYGYTSVVTIHSVMDIQVLSVPIQPKTLRSMNREGFSRRSSTVGPGFILRCSKPKISRYAYRHGNSSKKVVQQKSR